MARRPPKACFKAISGFGLSSFSRDELDTIHYGTLQALQQTGIKVESEQAMEIFHSAGCSVDRFEGYGIVKIPPHVVEDCIRWAPSTVIYHARDPEKDFVAEPKRFSLSNGGCCVNVIDPYTKEHRPSLKKDSGDIARVCDHIDEIGIFERACVSTDVPSETLQLHNLEAIVSNTSKHVFLDACTPENLRKMIEMGAACSGGVDNFKKRPVFTVTVAPNSPLCLFRDCSEVVVEAARQGVGLTIGIMSLVGATSPATLAGTLVTNNAEALSALILAQLTSKGAPCTYFATSIMMDLRTGIGALGASETGIISAGMAKMAQYYGLPCLVGGGGFTDSKIADTQAAYEGALNSLTAALAGANIIFGAGAVNQLLTIDYAKLVMDAEMFRMVTKIVRGIDVTDETLALDVIHEVSPGGEFLTHAHTRKHMRAMSRSDLFDWNTREAWVEAGEKDLTERAYERVRFILENHKPKPLPEGAIEMMRSIIGDYEAELGGKK